MADALTLARQLAALPGAPTFNDDFYCYTRPSNPPGPLGYRTRDGIGWVQDPEDLARYVLDLEDAGTGGVLLARAAGLVGTVEITSDTYYLRRDTNAPVIGDGPTLGIALARLIIARGGF